MKIGDKNYQTIWLDENDPATVCVIDQQKLPFFFEIKNLRSVDDVYEAIENMTVRGAPLDWCSRCIRTIPCHPGDHFPDQYPGTSFQCCQVSDIMPSDSCKPFMGCKLCPGKTESVISPPDHCQKQP